MKIKQVALNEVFWSISAWNRDGQAYNELKKGLGDTLRYFAKGKVGSGFFEWHSDVIGNWQPISVASDGERAMIDQKLGEISEDVRSKFPSDIADHILEVPNEGYIFYKPASDPTMGLDVLITGWGFRNFRKTPPVVIRRPPKQALHVNTISFISDGERLANRSFSLKVPWMQTPAPKVTNDEGLYVVEEKALGLELEVTDDLTGRQFKATINNENPAHEFDITEFTSVDVTAKLDGEPLSNEAVGIDYYGRHYDVGLVGGSARLEGLVLHEGQPLKATLRDQECEISIAREGNVVNFEFLTPPPPVIEEPEQDVDEPEQDVDEPETELDEPADPVMARLTVLDAAGQPMRDLPVVLSQTDRQFQYQLDEQGQTEFCVDDFDAQQLLSAQLTLGEQQLDPIDFTLDEGETDYVLQQNAPQGGSRLVEFLVALLMLGALAALAIFAFKPGIEELTKAVIK